MFNANTSVIFHPTFQTAVTTMSSVLAARMCAVSTWSMVGGGGMWSAVGFGDGGSARRSRRVMRSLSEKRHQEFRGT